MNVLKGYMAIQNKYTSTFTLGYKLIELTEIAFELLSHTSYTPHRLLLWKNFEKGKVVITKNSQQYICFHAGYTLCIGEHFLTKAKVLFNI